MDQSDEQLIDNFITEYVASGWLVVNRTPSSVQLRKPKEWSKGLLWVGAILLIVYGAGILLLILAAIDYATKKDQIIYVTAAELRHEPVETDPEPQPKAGNIVAAILLLLTVIGAYFLYF